jgi:hypothetical protein
LTGLHICVYCRYSINVEGIGDCVDGISAAETRTVREYEKRNKNRETLIEQFERKLKAASA